MAIPFSRSLRALEADTFRSQRWLLVGLGVLVAWMVWLFGARVGVYESSRRARVESSLAAHPVESPVTGRVTGARLRVGHTVQAGEILLELEAAPERAELAEVLSATRQLDAQLEEMRAKIATAEAMIPEIRAGQRLELEQLAAGIREAEAELAFDEQHLRRVEDLHEERLVSAEEVDEARAEVAAGAAKVERLRAARERRFQEHRVELRERENSLREDRRAAIEIEGRLEALAAEAERRRHRIEERVIRAPVGGRIGEVAQLEAGSVLEPGDAICSIVPQAGGQRIVAGFAPQRALGRLREGQTAQVRFDGFPWPEYGLVSARVESIGSESELDGEGLVRVELSLAAEELDATRARGAAPPPILEHGLPGEVRVLVERVSPATLLLRTLGRSSGRSLAEPGRSPRGAETNGARS